MDPSTPPEAPRPVRPRIGLVLGAGGEAGGVYIRAAVAALAERTGWHAATADTVIGTSAGAINGARLAAPSDATAPADLDALMTLHPGLAMGEATVGDRWLVVPRRLGGRLVAVAVPPGRHRPTYPVSNGPFHPGLHTVSVRRRWGGRRVVVLAERAEPTRELYASAAVPGVAPPVEIEGQQLLDGALHSPTNADLVHPDRHDLLVVIAPMIPLDGGRVLARTHRALLSTELSAWHRASRPVLVVAPTAAELDQRHDEQAFGQAARRRILEA